MSAATALALSHRSTTARVGNCAPCAAQRQNSQLGAYQDTSTPAGEECAGTGTKVMYAVGGGLVGLFAGWMLNDEMKGKIKARAKAGAATAAERAAARLRR